MSTPDYPYLIFKYKYVICHLGVPYSTKLWPGSSKWDQGRRPNTAFSSPRSQFFTIWTNPKPVNNLFIFPSSQMEKKLTEKTHASVTVTTCARW